MFSYIGVGVGAFVLPTKKPEQPVTAKVATNTAEIFNLFILYPSIRILECSALSAG